MFLKALTIKGFKSFADKTVLDFEPGVTVVVGPNGSGKSNLVDAVAWVLGAQGPRTLRGTKMDDVIFAGTAQRTALGRAEVALTIDNTEALLPIEFDEVTISRTLFRSGDSEYQINGVPCRLLDITELLSDSGIGRQQHVIVGQGQLDTVLNARPEDRRLIIEEAAGVLKYRKRREKAERRLVATEGNLLRLNDLLREVRRQLRPLEKQADAARRHDGVEAERRAIRLHLFGRDLEAMERRRAAIREERTRLGADDRSTREELRALDDAVMTTERSLITAGDDDLADMLARVEALRERGHGLRALASERERGLEMGLTAAADAGVVETLVADADALRRELDALAGQREELGGRIADGDPDAELADATAALRGAERRADRARARAEALETALEGVATTTESVAGLDATLGPLVDVLRIDEGMDAAVGAALGDALHGVVVRSGDGARRVFEHLAEIAEETPVGLLVPEGGRTIPIAAPPGTRLLVDVVEPTTPEIAGLVDRMLDGVLLVERDWRDALDVALAHPDRVVVTPSGARFGGTAPWRIAAAGHASTATLAAAREDAERAEAAIGTFTAQVDDARRRSAERRTEEVRLAGLDARRSLLETRLAEVQERLSSRDETAQAEARRRRDALVDRLEACRALRKQLDDHARRVAEVQGRVVERRRRQSEATRRSAQTLESLREQRRTLEAKLAETRELANRAEITQAELDLRHQNALETLRADFDCEPDAAKAAAAPEVPEGMTLAARARELDRELKLMGPINPLALAEFEALTERHEFLQGQLDDVKESRRELQRVIRAVDREIVAVFEGAFVDVEKNFSTLFTTLFPGGSGRIFLTEPDDPLNTGIEIEARPSGKNVRRLSLLSGGERSLTAMAFLFAVFRSRPSPFYLLDEVEAALDDVNLHRFLDLVHEFRDEAQLLIVSHQKRTMEAADLLYGVSMPPGGSSRVVSQRIEDHQEELVLD